MKMCRLVFLLFVNLPFVLLAQKKPFFDNIESGFYLYTNDLSFDLTDWKNFFAPQAKPQSQNFNLLDYQPPRDFFFFDIQGGKGLYMRSKKNTGLIKNSSHNQLYWMPGIGVHLFRYKSVTYSTVGNQFDTTKTYLVEQEQFQLRQTYADLYNAFTIEGNPATGRKLFGFIGLALQVSVPVSSRIKDNYTFYQTQWSTSLRRWVETPATTSSVLQQARKPLLFSGHIPLGFGVRSSKWISTKWGLEYYYETGIASVNHHKNYNEGVIFSFSLNYQFH